MITSIVTAPSRFPVTLAEVKTYSAVTVTTYDDMLETLIKVATDYVEQITQRKFVRQEWKVYFDDFPEGDSIVLPYGALQAVDSVKYKDSDGDENTFAATNYDIDTSSICGRVVLKNDKNWPTEELYTVNPVYVQFTCGYYTGTLWAASTAYASGTQVYGSLSNNFIFSSGGGTSDSSEPTWPTAVSGTVTDNDITWTALGLGVPNEIQTAIKIMVNDLFTVRETDIIGVGMNNIKLDTINQLIEPYKLDYFP